MVASEYVNYQTPYQEVSDYIEFSYNNINYKFDRLTFWDNFTYNNGQQRFNDLNNNSLNFWVSSSVTSYSVTSEIAYYDYLRLNGPFIGPIDVDYRLRTLFILGYGNPISSSSPISVPLSPSESVSLFGVSPNFFTIERNSNFYCPVPSEYVPFGSTPVPPSEFYVDSEGLGFLVHFGEIVLRGADEVYNLLSLGIRDTNFLSVMFGSGFLFFAGYAIIKWFIPI